MRNRPLASGCLILFLLIAIIVISGGAKFINHLRPSVLEKTVNGETFVSVSGQIYDIDIKEQYQILYLKKNSIIYQNESFKESRIIIYDDQKLNIEMGNQVEIAGEISFYEEERNPGNFNQKLYYQKQGINASVWASRIEITDNKVNRLSQALYLFREKWKQLLWEVLGKENGATLAAILLAEKSGMSEETKELYQVNGIGHILAISGLHLSVIGVGLYQICRRLSGSYFIGGIAGIIFLVIYILMIGMTVSVFRAFVMFLFRVGADISGRHYDSPTALAFAAIITLICNPLYLLDGGFWLSYGAVLAIIIVLPMFEKLPLKGLWASISINIMTVPILLYYFYEVPAYSVLLNMIVVPLMTVVLICGLTGSLCSAIFIVDGVFGIGGIGGALLGICRIVFTIYENVCEVFLKLPGSRIVAGQPQMWQMIVYYGVLLVVVGVWYYQMHFMKNSSIQRKMKWLMSMILFFNIVLIMFPVDEVRMRKNGEMHITVLDVGQGDGIFIRGPEGNTYLIDGGSSDIKKVGKYRIESFLKSQGIEEINYVFISHGDNDHINGIREMIERMDVGVAIETIVFPDVSVWDENLLELSYLAMKNEIRVVEMNAGQELAEGEMLIRCLAPEMDGMYVGESNMASMVLSMNLGEFDMLLTGDVEGEGEIRLTEVLRESYQDVRWDILKVAHHGSKNSSDETFLSTVRPSYSIISAGRENSYGHPHEDTIERLKNVESIVLSTQENGAITIETDGEKMKIEGYVK